MNYRTSKFSYTQFSPNFKGQLLQWVQKEDTFAWLDSNDFPQTYSSFQSVLALDVLKEFTFSGKDAFNKLDDFQKKNKEYLFGYLSYDLKNDIENLKSNNFDGLYFPDLYFFQPKKLFIFQSDYIEIQYHTSCCNDLEKDLEFIQQLTDEYVIEKIEFNILQRTSKDSYHQKFHQLQKYITRGDTYETNLCMEFFVENIDWHPYALFRELNQISKSPFTVFFRHQEFNLISASPERFIRKEGRKIISQPIKGTRKRGINVLEDLAMKAELETNAKERSENIMIVDLVRNDLSKTAEKGSVKVEELCKIYTFPTVHQMISTVTSLVKNEYSPVEIIQSLFPMGSMTGAPKKSTMQIIEELEDHKRGLYAGAFGYFSPQDDFDFNVVIRSLLINTEKKYLSFSVGGAITALSNCEDEYEECMLKAKNTIQTLNKFLKNK